MHVHKGVHLHKRMHGRARAAPALHRSILCVDVEGYGVRTNPDQLAVRRGLYRVLGGALAGSGVPEASCYCEDRGDGALILVGPDVPKERLARGFAAALADRLERHNAAAPAAARIRLRAAVHAGEVHHDEHGVAGCAINTAFRLLDAPPLRDALRGSPGVLALIASDWFYEEVVRQCACGADAYRPVRVSVKETDTRAWIRPPDAWGPAPAAAGDGRIFVEFGGNAASAAPRPGRRASE